MATFHGKDGAVYIGANAVAKVRNWSYDETAETADDTGMGDTEKAYKAGIKDGSGSVTCLWDPADTTGQNAITTGSTVTLNLYPEGNSAGNVELAGSVIVTGRSPSGDLGAVAEISFNFQGVLTEGTI